MENNFDPIIEFIKALDLFELKQRPSKSDLFLILLQMSRLFKELSIIKYWNVPEFQHPLIMNNHIIKNDVIKHTQVKNDDGIEDDSGKDFIHNFYSFIENKQTGIFNSTFNKGDDKHSNLLNDNKMNRNKAK